MIVRSFCMIKAEVVYLPNGQKPFQMHLHVESGATVADVLRQSGLFVSYPEAVGLTVGIFATIVSLDTVIKSGDRIEIYRPLLTDPMEKRR